MKRRSLSLAAAAVAVVALVPATALADDTTMVVHQSRDIGGGALYGWLYTCPTTHRYLKVTWDAEDRDKYEILWENRSSKWVLATSNRTKGQTDPWKGRLVVTFFNQNPFATGTQAVSYLCTTASPSSYMPSR